MQTDILDAIQSAARPGALPYDERDWLEKLYCRINESALPWLFHDEPDKRRRVYLEFTSHSNSQVFNELKHAGFDLKTVKPLKEVSVLNHCLSCLITGSTEAILRFLYDNPMVFQARIDLPEYTWLSSTGSVNTSEINSPKACLV